MGVNLDASPVKDILEDGSIISVSMPDINNDQVRDLRLTFTAGKADCEHNYFFLRARDGTFRSIEETPLGALLTGGDDTAFCYGDGVAFMRRGLITYAVILGEKTVYRVTEDATALKHCSFNELPWTGDQAKIAAQIRKAYPGALKNAAILRPLLETIDSDDRRPFAKKGDRVWTVVIKCNRSDFAHALFLVHSKTRAVDVVISPGGASSQKCD
jgi:hypothetical protein